MSGYRHWFSALFPLIFLGCVTMQQPPVKEKMPEITQPSEEKRAPGSLYNGYDNLFSDAKAYNVGDIVTIKVVENIQGTGKTDTQTVRDHSMDLNAPSITVFDQKIPGSTTVLGVNQKSANSFKGQGNTRRSANLIATITARVVKVYPNGNLYIVGKKIVKINDDTQVLKISGIVNPAYIGTDNSIDSSKISDMYVEYNGQGFMTQTQKPGWLANFLMKIWPF